MKCLYLLESEKLLITYPELEDRQFAQLLFHFKSEWSLAFAKRNKRCPMTAFRNAFKVFIEAKYKEHLYALECVELEGIYYP